MSDHPKPWLAHLTCGDATPTSVAATVGGWVSCGTCHDQREIERVSYALAVVPGRPVVQCELFTIAEIREAA